VGWREKKSTYYYYYYVITNIEKVLPFDSEVGFPLIPVFGVEDITPTLQRLLVYASHSWIGGSKKYIHISRSKKYFIEKKTHSFSYTQQNIQKADLYIGIRSVQYLRIEAKQREVVDESSGEIYAREKTAFSEDKVDEEK